MNVVVYARVSSVEQVAGYSIDAQVDQCRDWAHARGYIVSQIYIEPGQSAKTDDRPVFQRMIRAVCAGQGQAIVVHKVDRFARNLLDLLRYKKLLSDHDATIYSVTEEFFNGDSPENELVMMIMGATAEYVARNIGAGRVEIAGLFRDGWWNLIREKSPKITAAIKRGPAAIAKDIERRLLPCYAEIYERVEAAYREHEARRNAEIDAMSLIAEVTHSQIPRSQIDRGLRLEVRFGSYGNYRWPNGLAEHFYEGRLDLALHKVTPQEAAAVLETLIAIREKATL